MTGTKHAICALLLTLMAGLCACAHERSMIVLPFENLSAEPTDNWLRDAFSESLTDHLQYTKESQLKHREALNAACKTLDLPLYLPLTANEQAAKIGRELHAKFVMMGSFRNRDEQMFVFSRVIDSATGAVLNEYRHKAVATRNYRFFDQVREIADTALPAMGFDEDDIKKENERMLPASNRTRSFLAYEKYLHGRLDSFPNTEDDYRNAATWHREAIKDDYRFALAYVGLAETMASWGFVVKQSGRGYQDFYRKAHDSLTNARQYDPLMPTFHTERAMAILNADDYYVVGLTHMQNREYPQAIESFRRSLTFTPDDAMTYYRMGEAYRESGDLAQARAQYTKALDLHPGMVPAMDRLETFIK